MTIGGTTYPVPAPVPRARHAEPDRVRGHLPAARGAARPLPVQAPGRLPDASGTRRPSSSASSAGEPSRARGARRSTSSMRFREIARDGLRRPPRHRPTPSALADATRHPEQHGLDDLEPLDRVRREPARADRHGPGRPGARAAARPRLRDRARRRATSRPTCCATGSCSPTRRWPTASGPTTSLARVLAAVDPQRDEAARAAAASAARPRSAVGHAARRPAGPAGARVRCRRAPSRRSTSPSPGASGGGCPASTAAIGVGAGTELAQLRPVRSSATTCASSTRRRARAPASPHVRQHVPERALTTWLSSTSRRRWRSAPPTG